MSSTPRTPSFRIGPIAELVRDVEFFNADVVIFTGQRTGHAADFDYHQERSGPPHRFPRWSAAALIPATSTTSCSIVDGVIVASSLKVDGFWWNPVDDARAKRFVERARKAQ